MLKNELNTQYSINRLSGNSVTDESSAQQVAVILQY